MALRLTIFLLSIACSWAPHSPIYSFNRHPRNAPPPDPVDDIQFELPEIIVQTETATLEAFKVRTRNANEPPKWVSVGYPQLILNMKAQLFYFTPEDVSVNVKLLDQSQQQALVNKAKEKHPDQNIFSNNILRLPLAQFDCAVTFQDNGKIFTVKGSVFDLRRDPLALRFPLHRGSEKRSLFEKRINDQEPLIFKCELAATGKEERINTLNINRQQMQQIGMVDKILGPDTTETFVFRDQLTKLSQEIKTTLNIAEEYEIENDEFSDEFIQKILEGGNTQFQPISLDEALGLLSKYGVPSDKRDLSPNEIKREMSSMLEIKTDGNKQHIVTSKSKNEKEKKSKDNSVKVSLGIEGVFDASTEYANKKSNEWEKGSSSVDDQLKELNKHTQNSVTWEREGNRIIPKSLNVAKVTRANFDQQMSFFRIKKKISKARFFRQYEISTTDATLLTTYPTTTPPPTTTPRPATTTPTTSCPKTTCPVTICPTTPLCTPPPKAACNPPNNLVQLYRSYSAQFKNNFYTTSLNEAQRATPSEMGGYMREISPGRVANSPIDCECNAGGYVAVHRLYKGSNEGVDHLYANAEEAQSAAAQHGYKWESIGFYCSPKANHCGATKALHRYYFGADVNHFYTTDYDEGQGYVHAGRSSYEGVTCYVWP